MQCAITAASGGGMKLFFARRPVSWGALRCERAIPFKQDLVRYISTKALEMKNTGVDVRLGAEVTPELVKA